MYDNCPLIDSRKRHLKLTSIKYEHLFQLKSEQIEEGFTVEYKGEWNKEVREKHLCQTISSFANSNGGWLFIGISNDGSINEIKKEKSDFSQQISNLLSTHVTPIPLFNCRFIKSSAGATTGVLAIHVFEGNNPPYVSKGRIYVRNGSSKIPINANRADIDNLFAKSINYKDRLNELLVSPTGWSMGKAPYAIVAYCNSSYSNDRLSFQEIESLKKKMINSGSFLSSISTAESVIFLNSDIISPYNCTSYIELFFDKSIRVIYCIPCHPKEYRNNVKEHLQSKLPNMDISNFVMVNLSAIVSQVTNMCTGISLVLNEIKKDLRSYLSQAEFNNTQEVFAYFEPIDEFLEYVSKYGFRYSLKDKQRTFVDTFMDSKIKDQEGYTRAITYKYFAHALGFSPQEFVDLFCDLMEKHQDFICVGSKSYSYNYDVNR